MAKYLLDSNIITALEDRRKPGFGAITARLSELTDDDDVCISILSAYEYRYGIVKAPAELKDALRKAWQDFEARFSIIGLSLEGAEIFGEIKARYEKDTGAGEKSLQRHTVDFMLAGSAVEHEAVLVSDDGVFEKIRNFYPSLRVENWKESRET